MRTSFSENKSIDEIEIFYMTEVYVQFTMYTYIVAEMHFNNYAY